MKSYFIVPIILSALLTTLNLFGQHEPTLYGDTATGWHVIYKVQKKDNLFSISRKYGLKYQDIMDYNEMTIPEISISDRIKIPINKEQFINKDVVLSDDLLPLAHKTQPKEGLYRIGVSHYKTPIRLLMKWNDLENFDVKVDQLIVVGYVKSADAEVEYDGNPDKFDGKPYIPPLRASMAQTAGTTTAIVAEKSPTPVADQPSGKTKEAYSSNTTSSTVSIPSSPVKKINKGVGFFEKNFNVKWQPSTKGQKIKTVKASVFNSNSGWNDNKYYAMSSDIPVQSIVQITNPKLNKTIYAKILGALPSTFKQKGFDLIVSSAGAAELDVEVGSSVSLDCTY